MKTIKVLLLVLSSLALVACSDVPSRSDVEDILVKGVKQETGGLFAFEDIEIGEILDSEDGELVITHVSYKMVLAASEKEIKKLQKHDNSDVRQAAQMFALTNGLTGIKKGEVIDTVKNQRITLIKNDDGDWEVR